MLIAIAGIDGCGKSTQVQRIATWLRANSVEVEVIDKLDVLDRARHPECRFIKAEREELRGCVSEIDGPARTLLLFWTIALTVQTRRQAPGAVSLVDGYWMKHAAAELLYGARPALVEAIVETLPATDATFYLDAEPASILQRKHQLTAYECGLNEDGQPAAYVAHQTALRGVLTGWAARYGWCRAPVHLSIEETSRFLQGHLTRLLTSPSGACASKETTNLECFHSASVAR